MAVTGQEATDWTLVWTSLALPYRPFTMLPINSSFRPEVAAHLEETPLADDQTMTPLPNGRVIVAATVREALQLRWWLQGFGDAVEVLSPPALRQQQAETARRVADRYNQGET